MLSVVPSLLVSPAYMHARNWSCCSRQHTPLSYKQGRILSLSFSFLSLFTSGSFLLFFLLNEIQLRFRSDLLQTGLTFLLSLYLRRPTSSLCLLGLHAQRRDDGRDNSVRTSSLSLEISISLSLFLFSRFRRGSRRLRMHQGGLWKIWKNLSLDSYLLRSLLAPLLSIFRPRCFLTFCVIDEVR